MPEWPITWTTLNELDFLDRLGFHKPVGSHSKTAILSDEDRRSLLLGYRKGALLRTVWIGVNREQVLAHVDSLLSRLPAVPNPNPSQGDQS